MTSTKHTVLLAFVSLQLIGAMFLIASYFLQIWPLELLVSFTPQVLTILILSLIISSIRIAYLKNARRSPPFLVVVGATWLAASIIVFCALSAQPSPHLVQSDDETTIRFATFNKLYSNHDLDSFTDYFSQHSIDVLALQEVRPSEVPSIAQRLGFEYTHSSRPFTTSGGTSVALLSHFPFASAETIELATEHPVVRAVVNTPLDGKVAVYSVHLPVPSSPFLYNKRNTVLNSLAKTVEREALPVIIGGDFNTTVFSPTLHTFNDSIQGRLQSTTTGAIPLCSWYGYGSPLCIRIDHIFIPTSAKLTDFTIAPDHGSDHRALIAEIDL